MIHVVLQTSDGKFVADQAIPPFNEPPKVIMWGSRVFTHFDSFTDDWGTPAERYREAFSYWINGMELDTWAELVRQKTGVTIHTRPR